METNSATSTLSLSKKLENIGLTTEEQNVIDNINKTHSVVRKRNKVKSKMAKISRRKNRGK